MTNVLRFKNPHCIEWILGTTTNNTGSVSSSFKLRNVKCNLSFESNGTYNAYLYCESNLTFNPAIDMIATATSSYGYYANASNYIFKRTKFTGRRVEIWRHNSQYHLGTAISLTFEVITLDINILKGKILEILNCLKNIVL